MPRASANSFFERDVRITMMMSLPISSSFLLSPGFSPNVWKNRQNDSSTIKVKTLENIVYIYATLSLEPGRGVFNPNKKENV